MKVICHQQDKHSFKQEYKFIFSTKKRYDWMNKYLRSKKVVYELGCGCGFPKNLLKQKT